MSKKIKMTALKPFVFNGEMLKVDEEFEPDNQAQADLLAHIGHAKVKRRTYMNRMIQPTRTAVMTSASAGSTHEPEA